jgi:succinate dehydrogenase / fumarate reductase, cytochrome b subunit
MAKINSQSSDGKNPSLPYSRNIAYTWQRITSILLIIGIGLHVYYMRFHKEPESVQYGLQQEHFVKLSVDPGLYVLAPRLNLLLFDAHMIALADSAVHGPMQAPKVHSSNQKFNPDLAIAAKKEEHVQVEKQYVDAMKKLAPDASEVVAMCGSFGTASLMMLRDTFKSVWMCIIYTLFVLVACFHGCNGLWTFAITWGVSLSENSRRLVRVASNALMALLIFLGLSSIWGVYWINLRY